LFPFCVAKVRL